MPLLKQGFISRRDLRANPDVFYVFGDNEARVGYGGQAREMRGEPNAIGVATLAAPGAFWGDADAARQRAVIDRDVEPIRAALLAGKVVVLPLDGLGTGLAQLETKSPTTFAYLREVLARLEAEFG